MGRPTDSPLLLSFLRALSFVGVTEAIFRRLLPEPVSSRPGTSLERIHVSLSEAGEWTFSFAFILVTLALVAVASRALRHRHWPAGLNGFLVVCFACLAMLGLSAMVVAYGPLFPIGFTALSGLTLVALAMHSFSARRSWWDRAFAVFYTSAILCSLLSSMSRLSLALPADASARRVLGALDGLSGPALSAGRMALTLASVAAFMAYCDFGRDSAENRWSRFGGPIALSSLAAIAFMAGCLLAPPDIALLGFGPPPATVLLLTCALFLAGMAATANLFSPERRGLGYGLLLLILAGFPLRIAYEHMLMVLGAALIFIPERGPELLEVSLPRFISAGTNDEGEASPPQRPAEEEAVTDGAGRSIFAADA
ncbi:MAG TPA: hypothetical protein VFG76_02225 [Candidatus Polarisedimenticolia bacterium]|nr:hypothetical protein [Candidatus Polarisedimenticolia bacterium]